MVANLLTVTSCVHSSLLFSFFFQLVVISVDKCIGKRTHKKLDRSTEG